MPAVRALGEQVSEVIGTVPMVMLVVAERPFRAAVRITTA